METELVVHPEKGGVDFLLGDPPGGADIFAAVMAVTDPEGLAVPDLLPVQCPALTAEYRALQRGTPALPGTLLFAPSALQLLDGLEGNTVDDGRVGGLRVILLPLPVVFHLLGGEGVGGIGFLPEGVPDVPFVLYCQAGTKRKSRKIVECRFTIKIFTEDNEKLHSIFKGAFKLFNQVVEYI